jgi:hypothetical protein
LHWDWGCLWSRPGERSMPVKRCRRAGLSNSESVCPALMGTELGVGLRVTRGSNH